MLKKRTGRVGDFFKWDDAEQPVVEARCPRWSSWWWPPVEELKVAEEEVLL